MERDEYQRLARLLIGTAQAAGRAEMDVYRQDFDVDTKKDNSPVTKADRAAEVIILADLARFAPDIPVVAEEAASEGHIPEIGDRFFLVDPLDGTKEFIKKSNEFTVNIALIEQGVPVFGLVYVPALGDFYLTLGPEQVVHGRMDADGLPVDFNELELTSLTTKAPSTRELAVVASKSHMTVETKDYLEQFSVGELKSAGSSLKFCLLASGDADLYPRFGPTMEWDTAAGHAVVLAAGGCVLTEQGVPLTYGKVANNYLNPFFIAWGHKASAPENK